MLESGQRRALAVGGQLLPPIQDFVLVPGTTDDTAQNKLKGQESWRQRVTSLKDSCLSGHLSLNQPEGSLLPLSLTGGSMKTLLKTERAGGDAALPGGNTAGKRSQKVERHSEKKDEYLSGLSTSFTKPLLN